MFEYSHARAQCQTRSSSRHAQVVANCISRTVPESGIKRLHLAIQIRSCTLFKSFWETVSRSVLPRAAQRAFKFLLPAYQRIHVRSRHKTSPWKRRRFQVLPCQVLISAGRHNEKHARCPLQYSARGTPHMCERNAMGCVGRRLRSVPQVRRVPQR